MSAADVAVALVISAMLIGLTCLIALTLRPIPGGVYVNEDTSDTPRGRSERLLRELLDEHEYRQLRQRGYVDVVSPSNSTRIYRIPRMLGRVCVYEGGREVRELCLQPVEFIPSADVVAMHKLMILGAEDVYLAQANQFNVLMPRRRYRP